MSSEANNNWAARATGERLRIAPDRPVPLLLQTGRQTDFEAYLPDPGGIFPSPAQVIQAARRLEHPADDRKLSVLEQILLFLRRNLGRHGQVFTNFRAAVPQNDTVVLPFNATRSYLMVINVGTQPIRLAFGREADFVSGVPVVAGGFYEPILGTVSEVRAVSNAANQAIVVVEGLYYFGGNRVH